MQQTTKLGASLIILLIVNGIRLYQYVTEPHTVSSVSNGWLPRFLCDILCYLSHKQIFYLLLPVYKNSYS